MLEKILNDDVGRPRLRVAYPVEFQGREFLTVQKTHYVNNEGVVEWRGGIWIGIDDEGDLAAVEWLCEAMRELVGEVWEGIID